MQDNRIQRRVAIIVASILGLTALLYFGGLLAQLYNNYQDWLAAGGINGGMIIKPPDFSPLTCIPYSLSRNGLVATGLIILITSGIMGTC